MKRPLFIIASLSFAVLLPQNAKSQGTDLLLVPIADGNTWIYSYGKETQYKYGAVMFPPGSYFIDTVKNGTFKISLSSVLTRNDSTFFTVTTLDSGIITTRTGYIGMDTTTTIIGYDTTLSAECMMTDSLLYLKDSLSSWLFYNPWYLSYQAQGDTYSNNVIPSSPPYTFQQTYQRDTLISDTTISSIYHVLYATNSRRYSYHYIQIGPYEESNSTYDTLKWITDIGSPYRIHTNLHLWGEYPDDEHRTQETEYWVLDSFTIAATPVLHPATAFRNTPELFSIPNASGIVWYSLPERTHVRLRYYDLRGRLIATLVNTSQCAGYHSLSIKNALPSRGIYICVFEAGSFIKHDLTTIAGK